jgi:23S rRNA (uracil1939-C5)-methyltransferase
MLVQPGQHLELTIENISHQGEGVAKYQGYTVFVPFGAPGDLVKAQVISAKKDYARAIIKEILQPGQRVEPKCPWFQECGGCNLQHLNYDIQLAIKTETVRTTLKRIGGISPDIVKDILPTRAWSYRNKLQAPVAMHMGQLTAGLYKPRSHDLIPVSECAIQEDVNNQVAKQIAIIARETGVTAWEEREQKGSLRHILIRHSQRSGLTLAALVVSVLDFPNRERFLKKLREEMPDLHSLVLNENPRPTNVILGDREEVIWGPGYITDAIGELTFKISARSFWQVNSAGAEKIFQKVREFAQLQGEETVMDIYCGTGSIGLFLADQATRVIGIESNLSAIEDARDNARMNGIGNAEFHAGRAEDLLPQMVQKGLKADVIVLDPPRKGCEPSLLEAVAQAKPLRIVYVSCNPATLARDLKLLAERGYLAREVQPVDMFPQTSHVETVVLIQRAYT